MDYQRRPYTASVGPSGGAGNDRVSHNLLRAESLLDEPETGFSIGGNFGASGAGGGNFGMGSGIGSGIDRSPTLGGVSGGGQGTSQFLGGRSNYTGSEMGDSDTHSNIQSRPKWGQQPTLGGASGLGAAGGGGISNITEIGTFEVAGSRRSNRFMGGAGTSSNHSGSIHANRQTSAGGSRLFAGAGNTGSGYNDILDNAMNQPTMSRGRSGNLLSDAGSKYGGDEDEMSHYMGQSALGGASNVGGGDVSSNAGGYHRANHASVGGQDQTLGGRSTGSRRQQVLERNNLGSGSGRDEDSRRGRENPLEKKKTENYGLFLGGSNVPPRPVERSKTEHRALGDQGNTIGSNDSLGMKNVAAAGGAFVRDRSFPAQRQNTTTASGFGIGGSSFDANKDIDSRSIGGRSRESQQQLQNASPSPTAQNSSTPYMNISIHDNKREYLKEKERKDLNQLENDLRKEKDKLAKIEEQFNRDIEALKEKQSEELSRVEQGHRDTLDMLNREKDKIMGTLGESLEKEATKMEQLHQQDLANKEKVNRDNTESIKLQLSKETQNLESQVSQQNELREILEAVQKRTVDITEIVESSLRQREDELKRQEIELAKEERQMIEDEVIQIDLEEKKLAEEERKLQLTKDVLLKLKQSQNQEINRMREQRQASMASHLQDEQRLRMEERQVKENLSIAKKRLEQANEKRSAQNRLIEVELTNKESEVQNAQDLLEKEKAELETEQRENYIREIQVKQIDIEDRKKLLSNNEHELRRQQRLLEKKRELIDADRSELEENMINFEQEKIEFEGLAEKIQETSERLQVERDKVLEEKATFDFEKEQLDKIKHDIDIERSLLQAEFLRAEELEHELIHRENMLKMLLFNKEHKEKQRDAAGLLPPYTSCPNLKMENVQGHNMTALSPGGEFYDRNGTTNSLQHTHQQTFAPHADTYASNHYQQPQYTASQNPSVFNYNRYMQELSAKLGNYTLFSGRDSGFYTGGHQRQDSYGSQPTADMNNFAPPNATNNMQADGGPEQFSPHQPGHHVAFSPQQNPRFMSTGEFADPRGGMLSSVTKSGRGFREKILQQLGNAQLDDSRFNSNSEQDYDPTGSLGINPVTMQGSMVKPPDHSKVIVGSTQIQDL